MKPSPAQDTRPLPRIRIVDAVATGAGAALEPADGRLVEFTLGELKRLVQLLSGEGLEALCAYLEVLVKETGPDGRPILVVPEFSGAWVQQHTSLGRNAAYRAQQSLEASGLFTRIVSQPGHGARGKQRGRLNPELVLIPGGADGDVASLRTARPGRRNSPVSPDPGNRETGPSLPVSRQVGDRESGPLSRFADSRETGPTAGVSSQVSSLVPDTGSEFSTGPTSSTPVVEDTLLSSPETGPGLLRRVLVPALRREPALVRERLTSALNQDSVATRLEALVPVLRIDPPRATWVPQFVDYLCRVLVGEVAAQPELYKLHVSGRHVLPADQLTERLVLGLVIGVGMTPQVGSWGAWLHAATRTDWAPKTDKNRALERFTAVLARFADAADAPTESDRGVGGPAAADAPPPSAEKTPESEAEDAPTSPELDDAVVEEHFAAARSAYDHLFRSRPARAEDPTWRRRVVRMYLDEHGSEEARSA